MKKAFLLCIALITMLQTAVAELLYESGVYGQTFELCEETEGDKTRLNLLLMDNKTKQTRTYDAELPTAYLINSKWFTNASEYSKAVKACKNFCDHSLNLVYLADMKDICDIAPCCTPVSYRIAEKAVGNKDWILIEYNCSNLDLLFEIAERYNQKGRVYVLREYAK